MFHFKEYSNSQRKQAIDAEHLYEIYLQKLQNYDKNYKFTMFFRQTDNKEYLVKEKSSSKKSSYLGERSPESEAILQAFKEEKANSQIAINALKDKLTIASKINKFEKITRVPNALIDIFRKINHLGLDEKLIAIGTNALYAYESKCGVFIEQEHLSTVDIDILNKNDKKLSFIFNEIMPDGTLTKLLGLIDKTFEPQEKIPYRFVNKNGVIVELLTPSHSPLKNSHIKNNAFVDIIPLEMEGMQWLENARLFSSLVVGEDGRCAIMTTIHPLEFAIYKNWLSSRKDRDVRKKLRDKTQAQLITSLILSYMPQINIENELLQIKTFKTELIEDFKQNILKR
ncbi:MAG: GSU2403 family nucleotidyltransferase fold protein [Sulfurospirillaceae bacterium]|nr:GSU2403 family nucleotidyltransferase fold protein [Sulfurospirillaceae bacterium]MDD3463199.1 GSU2403 family nucleotidyltransferase fold protein [Sulfurospirillaceae bacterium]